jgi:cysteinyl-tRNA synthetase
MTEVDRLRDVAEEAQNALPDATVRRIPCFCTQVSWTHRLTLSTVVLQDAENTIRHLRTTLTQQERLVATLSSDKEKLEQYIKSRLEKLEQVHKEVRFPAVIPQ